MPRCPSTDVWIKKMWYLSRMEFYSDIKNELLLFAGKWIELENIILSELCQLQKAKGCMFCLMHRIQAQYKYMQYHIYIYIYTQYVHPSGTGRKD
jgi:hypothetical protein